MVKHLNKNIYLAVSILLITILFILLIYSHSVEREIKDYLLVSFRSYIKDADIDLDLDIELFSGVVNVHSFTIKTSEAEFSGSSDISGFNFFGGKRLSGEFSAVIFLDEKYVKADVMNKSSVIKFVLSQKARDLNTSINYIVQANNSAKSSFSLSADLQFSDMPEVMKFFGLNYGGLKNNIDIETIMKIATSQLVGFDIVIENNGYLKDAWVQNLQNIHPAITTQEASRVLEGQVSKFEIAVLDAGLKNVVSQLLFHDQKIKITGKSLGHFTLYDVYLSLFEGEKINEGRAMYKLKVVN